jgi:hypothetical protein
LLYILIGDNYMQNASARGKRYIIVEEELKQPHLRWKHYISETVQNASAQETLHHCGGRVQTTAPALRAQESNSSGALTILDPWAARTSKAQSPSQLAIIARKENTWRARRTGL